MEQLQKEQITQKTGLDYPVECPRGKWKVDFEAGSFFFTQN